MADELGLGTFAISKEQISSTIGATTEFIFWALIALSIVLIVWGCFYLLSFKRPVRVRQKTNSGYVILDTKAREFKTKSGVVRWRFLKWIKNSYLAPPDGYLEITSKGKYSGECIRSIDGVVTWIKRGDLSISGDVFSSEERTVVIEEFRRAEEYKKSKLSDKLWQAAPLIAILIIFTLLLVFWGDLVEPSAQLANQNAIASERLADALSAMSAVCLNNTQNYVPQPVGFVKVNSSKPIPN